MSYKEMVVVNNTVVFNDTENDRILEITHYVDDSTILFRETLDGEVSSVCMSHNEFENVLDLLQLRLSAYVH